MLRDVFYYGKKPNVHPRERFAKDLVDAKAQSTTEHFWIINEFCDYRGFDWDFDFEFLPDEDVWAEDHYNVWPSQHQKDSGTWLCNTDNDEPLTIYRADVGIVKRKNIKSDNWIELSLIDKHQFDFSWHPDPTDPPYIYVWGNQWHSGKIMPTVEYHVSGATERKHIEDSIAILAPNVDVFDTFESIENFDYSWTPNPTSPPYIYAWGNQWNKPEDKISVQYSVEGATEYKYMDNNATRKPCMDNWEIPANVDVSEFDFSWEPSPADPAFIYQFGTQWQKTGGPRYVVEGATEVKFVSTLSAKALVTKDKWTLPTNIDVTDFDFSWHPDDTSPPYIYVFPTQWALSGGPVYTVDGATEIKYVEDLVAKAVPDKTNWEIPAFVDSESFDYSWHPYAQDEPYIYQFGTQWQKTGGPVYKTPGVHKNSAIKYIDTRILKSKRLPSKKGFATLNNYQIKDFDYSWHPDTTDEPYIYVFGNNLYPAEIMPTIEYAVPGATQIKYVNEIVATLTEDKTNWEIPDNIDTTDFDFSWKPNPKDPPFIYVFGTQWQRTGGPRYVVPDATEFKFVDTQKVKAVETETNWTLPTNIDAEFDFSWHPDDMSPPYIYYFATQWALSGGPVYTVPGATEVKYVEDLVAKALPDKTNWEVPAFVDSESFDFSWHPYVEDEPYIYQFGTQWQKTGGPVYKTPGVHKNSPVKYIDTRILKSKRLPSKKGFATLGNLQIKDFDYSWHPDTTDEPYIYVFGNNFYSSEFMPTIEYVVPGAKQIKYVHDIVATLAVDMTNWEVPENIDVTGIDFSWKPNPKDPPFIYQYGTQHQKTGGPRYIVPGATEVKYVEEPRAKSFASKDNWEVPSNIDVAEFDFSWHPDDSEPPYIYVFGTQWALTGGPKYTVPGATEVKYIDTIVAKAAPNRTHWTIPDDVDTTTFDFSWHPYAEDEPFIYQFGTQWQKTGGPIYMPPEADETCFTKYIDTRILKATKLPHNKYWSVVEGVKIAEFDYSWHHDETEEPYIYVFGNNLYPAEIMPTVMYTVPGATKIKYISNIIATLAPNRDNWEIPDNLDVSKIDFSWMPNPKEPAYIYQYGTQHQRSGGPRYVVPGATDIKYIDIKAKKLPNKNNWKVIDDLTISEFDYSWHPDDSDDPFNYVFGNNQYPGEIMPTIQYCVEGATSTKNVNTLVAKHSKNMSNWEVPNNVDTSDFDFSWVPNPKEPAYIYQFATQWQKTGGPRYVVPGAVDTKFDDSTKAKKLPSKLNWVVPANIDESSIDYSWHPDSTEAPFIYHFGTQWNDRGGPEYHVPGATEYKYISDIVGKTKPNKTGWKSLFNIEEDKFDYTWVPHPEAPPYIYVFGNQWNVAELEPTVQYTVEGATEIKYIRDVVATVAQSKEGWKDVEGVESFDYSWRPNPTSPPYVYIFGNKQYPGNIMPTVTLTIGDATQEKFVDDIVATLKQEPDRFVDTKLIKEFDYSWRPNPKDPPYIYQFGTQWAKTHGPKYIVKGATETKYVDDVKAIIMPDMTYWDIPSGINVSKFDFSWHPDANSPKYIYQFGTITDPNDGPRYVVPGATEVVNMERVEVAGEVFIDYPKYFVETTLEALVEQHNGEVFWALNSEIDYTDFDFNWRPDIQQAHYVHAFGSSDSETTQTYFINSNMWDKGYRELNWVVDEKLDEQTLAKLFKKPDMFFVDKGNIESQARFEKLKAKFDNIQKTRYLNTWVDTINRCINRSTTNLCWILNSELDYDNFDFEYYPNPWQMKMVHVFGTQWSHWGTTFMVNRETFAEDTKYIKIIEHLSCLNFVKERRAVATNRLYDVVYIDHGNDIMFEADSIVIKYEVSYLNTFKKLLDILPTKKEHYIWICSSICDYAGFDFTYICDPFAREQLHVFPSDKQKFGDTFLVNVNKLRELIENMSKLEDYTKINYNQHQRVKRLPAPTIITEEDTHVSIINADYNWPYATFVTADNQEIQTIDTEPMSLWAPEHKNIVVTSVGGTRIIAPKEIKDHVKRELYDYPYIITNNKLSQSKPLDIVFLSNGEKGADENYEHLLNVTTGLKNRITRVDGVNGRVAAYHAAAEASNTPWMFTVFAKLKVSAKFDFNWQPDRLQIPKHYVFHAKNPVNGLVYGHQAMIAYNKKLTLANTGKGLDFTMDDEHEIVEIMSGIANFNTDEYSTWRTAFREALKLRANDDEVSKNRLEFWLTVGSGKFSDYSIEGASHAVEYYESVNGDPDKLKLSYEWAWLRSYFESKYK
jgi:hypothetical protein